MALTQHPEVDAPWETKKERFSSYRPSQTKSDIVVVQMVLVFENNNNGLPIKTLCGAINDALLTPTEDILDTGT